MFEPSSPLQNPKCAPLGQSGANLQQPQAKSSLDVSMYGLGHRSSSSLDVLSAKAGDGNLPNGITLQFKALFAPQDIGSAGYGGSAGSTDDGSGLVRFHYNQGIGNGAEGGDPGNSHPHGGSNDETGRTPGQRLFF